MQIWASHDFRPGGISLHQRWSRGVDHWNTVWLLVVSNCHTTSSWGCSRSSLLQQYSWHTQESPVVEWCHSRAAIPKLVIDVRPVPHWLSSSDQRWRVQNASCLQQEFSRARPIHVHAWLSWLRSGRECNSCICRVIIQNNVERALCKPCQPELTLVTQPIWRRTRPEKGETCWTDDKTRSTCNFHVIFIVIVACTACTAKLAACTIRLAWRERHQFCEVMHWRVPTWTCRVVRIVFQQRQTQIWRLNACRSDLSRNASQTHWGTQCWTTFQKRRQMDSSIRSLFSTKPSSGRCSTSWCSWTKTWTTSTSRKIAVSSKWPLAFRVECDEHFDWFSTCREVAGTWTIRWTPSVRATFNQHHARGDFFSSSEAEFHALVKVTSAGLGAVSELWDLGLASAKTATLDRRTWKSELVRSVPRSTAQAKSVIERNTQLDFPVNDTCWLL